MCLHGDKALNSLSDRLSFCSGTVWLASSVKERGRARAYGQIRNFRFLVSVWRPKFKSRRGRASKKKRKKIYKSFDSGAIKSFILTNFD